MDSLAMFLTKRVGVSILVAIGLLLAANFLFNRFTPTAVDIQEPLPIAQPAPVPELPQAVVTETAPEASPSVKAEEATPAPKQEEAALPAPATPEPPATPAAKSPPGIAFVNALVAPLSYELNERFYGWHPNDILNFTDNVENMQRGVLETTRRAVRVLTERISRTGNTIAFNKHLENATNSLSVKADTYWFPSPERKYQEALDELEDFKTDLMEGKASFLTRDDNLIPLLQVFEDLLGSCEENLVKKTERDGSPVGSFVSDDYFFYAQGVAMTMRPILEAVREDFKATVATRRGAEILDSAIDSLRRAEEIDPLIILNSDPDSLFANHRANMAAPIGRAKFYIEVMITALSS